MKSIYFLLILTFSAATLTAAPINSLVVNNGNWKTAASWSLGRVPANGDSVVIPAGFTAVVNATINLSASTLKIAVYGTLSVLQNGSLKLGVNSIIKVYTGGTVKPDPSDNDNRQAEHASFGPHNDALNYWRHFLQAVGVYLSQCSPLIVDVGQRSR